MIEEKLRRYIRPDIDLVIRTKPEADASATGYLTDADSAAFFSAKEGE